MCGLLGTTLDLGNNPKGVISSALKLIKHRGPDDQGFYGNNWVNLGFRRLSILDLSRYGHQPMNYDNLTILHNGEIYNYIEIRDRLISLGYSFSSNSDTEVFLKAFHCWGVESLTFFNGMFATVIVNNADKSIYLFRDRIGIKPLYYIHHSNKRISFASEIKVFKKFTTLEENTSKIRESLVYRSLIGDETVFSNINSVNPGDYILYHAETGELVKKTYYKPNQEISKFSEGEAILKVEELLIDSIGKRLVSDVEVGLQLSGGVDSSLIAGIVQTHFKKNKLHSFSVSVPDFPEHDESYFQKIVADRYNIEHHNIKFTSRDFLKYLDVAVQSNDSPIVHPNAVAIMKLTKYAKNFVTVLLSGEGADEAFFGYQKHKYAEYRKYLSLIILGNPILSSLLPNIGKLGVAKRLTKNKSNFGDLFVSSRKNVSILNFMDSNLDNHGFENRLKFMHSHNSGYDLPRLDQATSLRSLLHRYDRMTMASSIEGRVPFCDHRIMELANSLPTNMKVKPGNLKFILKKISEKYLPTELIYREKMGFSLPIRKWFDSESGLRNKLSILESDAFLEKGIVNPDKFIPWFKKNRYSDSEFEDVIWPLLSYELWYRNFIKK
jgi:asparagine synthase (glutamine-hydrolysing)